MEKSVNSFVTNFRKNHQNFKQILKWMWKKLHIWAFMSIIFKYHLRENMSFGIGYYLIKFLGII